MWSIVQINGDQAGIAVDNGPHRDRTVDTETFTEDLETVKLVNETAGDVVCSYCGERWGVDDDHDEAAAEQCPEAEDNVAHDLVPDHLSWFEEAAVRVRDADEEVSVELVVKGKRFRIGVHFASGIVMPGDVQPTGALVLSLPGTSGTRDIDGVTVVAD